MAVEDMVCPGKASAVGKRVLLEVLSGAGMRDALEAALEGFLNGGGRSSKDP